MMGLDESFLAFLDGFLLFDTILPSNRFMASNARALGDNAVKRLNASSKGDPEMDASFVNRFNARVCFLAVGDGGWRGEIGGTVSLAGEAVQSSALGSVCSVLWFVLEVNGYVSPLSCPD